MDNKKRIIILSVVTILLLSYAVFDAVFYKHNVKSVFGRKMTKMVSNSFATVGLINNPIATSTVKVAVATSTTTTISKFGLPPESPANYTDNGNGTITDNHTGLLWAKCPQGLSGKDCGSGSVALKEWAKAGADCKKLSLAGKTSWRLPELKELESIVDTGTFDPSINKKIFPKSTSDPYWSNTAPARYLTSRFTVLFSDGSVYTTNAGGFAAYRCVWGGVNK